jgi:hypothetical protein
MMVMEVKSVKHASKDLVLIKITIFVKIAMIYRLLPTAVNVNRVSVLNVRKDSCWMIEIQIIRNVSIVALSLSIAWSVVSSMVEKNALNVMKI